MPRDGVNVYLLGDVLVDAGMGFHAGKILKAISGHTVRAHAITHAHPDHVGASKKVADALDIPVWIGDRDAEAAETGRPVMNGPVAKVMGRMPKTSISRTLGEGDEIGAGFVVLDTPGHSPGHVSFWRESDRVLVCGDVWWNMNILTTVPGLRQPAGLVTPDPERNRDSERRLAALEPRVVAFGHGPVLREGAAEKLASFVEAL